MNYVELIKAWDEYCRLRPHPMALRAFRWKDKKAPVRREPAGAIRGVGGVNRALRGERSPHLVCCGRLERTQDTAMSEFCKIGFIYLLSFPGGRRYVGQTVNRINNRLSEHRCAARRGDSRPVCRAWRKYGAPVVEVLACVAVERLNETEVCYVAAFDTHRNGYNRTTGGDGTSGLIASDETRGKLSIARRRRPGKPCSPETKAKIAAALRGRGHTPERRENQSKAKVGVSLPEYRRRHLRQIALDRWNRKKIGFVGG